MKKDINLNNVSATRKYVDDAIKNIEIPEGFSGDYNDLTNKPFYDTREYEDVVIEYDGNTEGRTICSIPAMSITTAYKVADLTAEQLAQYRTSCANGFTLTYLKEDGSTEVVQSSVVYGFMGTSISLYAGGVGQVFLAVDTFSTEIGHADNYVNEAGIYFKEKKGTNPYKVIKLEFQNTSGELKIIEPQFLTNSPGIKVEEGTSCTSQYNSQTYVAQNNAEIFNDTHNMATGQYSHAEGKMTEAHGNYSHAEGNGSAAIGEHSHAEGAHTQATGMASHSEGWNTTASGWYSHAEGQTTTAEGSYSHAEGDCNYAIGDNSHVEGTYNKAYGECQHVQGKHAIPDEEGRYAHIVGNGEYAQNRKKDSNAHTLDWDGNAWFAGDVFVGGNNQDDAQKLATEGSVNDAINIDYETLAFDTDEIIIDGSSLPDSTLDTSQLNIMTLSGEDVSSFALEEGDSYNRQNFVPYQILKADHLNNIENGIIANENAISNMASDVTANNAALSAKQDKLVSGTSIKTINGESILGSGNISIAGGGSTNSAINYDLNVKAINHRGYSRQAPENTIPAYIMSKQMGYTYVECDVSFTADSVAVLLHDSTIDRTSDGSGNIQSLTYQQLLQYDFGSWFNRKYAGTKIPTFKEFMMYCKGLALHPYIELKISGGYTEEQIKQVVDEVELCGMKGKVTYISFDAKYLEYVKKYDEEARLGYLADVKTFTIKTANGLKTGKNEVFMDVDYRNATEEKVALCIENGLPMEVWTVNDANIIKKLNPYVSGVTSDNQIAGKILYDLYSTYTDTDYIPATSITLNKTSLTFEDLNTQKLTATVAPSNASGSVVWKSSNTSIATVSNGVVTPLKDGSCTITASIDSVSASCSITIATVGNVYSVTENLTGCTSSNNAVNVVEGEAYTDTFTHIIGYTLEGATVSITMGGVDASNYYNDGVLNIPSVTGDIVVTIIAKEKEVVKYNITRNLTNCTSSSSAIEAIEDESHTEIFTAPFGYTLEGATVSITMGGTDVSSYYNNGTLNIPSVTGDIVINIVAKEKVLLKYSITRNLTNCNSSSDVIEVTETQAHTETFTADTGYIILRSKVSITMGGTDISNYYTNGTLNIPSVTGDIVITIEGAELSSPVIDYAFSTDGTNGILTNTGTGGNTYDIQTVGEYSVADNKLSLLNGAYASVDYPTTRTGTFTIHVRGCFDNIIGNQYERMMRSNNDALCVYYVKGSKNFGVKLANVGGGNNTVYDTSKAGWSGGSNTMNVDYDVIGVETIHDFVFTADGTTIKFYLDGELLASQDQSVLKAGTSYAIGNMQKGSNSYNANITIEKWRIFAYTLSAEEVAGLISSN